MKKYNLHSNMVRFIINIVNSWRTMSLKFTFQYGQIYYPFHKFSRGLGETIYIPIWLDLLSAVQRKARDLQADLHSNMVRFIIPQPSM